MKEDLQEPTAEILAIAKRLDCITEWEFCELLFITQNTAQQWRNRGIAPLPIRLGNNYFYPIDAIKAELTVRAKKRRIDINPRDLIA